MICRETSSLPFLLLFALCRAADLPAAEDRTVELAKKEVGVSFYTSMAAEESKLLADAFQPNIHSYLKGGDPPAEQRKAAPSDFVKGLDNLK
jgi:hypothetical protein